MRVTHIVIDPTEDNPYLSPEASQDLRFGPDVPAIRQADMQGGRLIQGVLLLSDGAESLPDILRGEAVWRKATMHCISRCTEQHVDVGHGASNPHLLAADGDSAAATQAHSNLVGGKQASQGGAVGTNQEAAFVKVYLNHLTGGGDGHDPRRQVRLSAAFPVDRRFAFPRFFFRHKK